GKPVVAQINHEKERIYFIGHEPVSALMSLHIMNKLNLTHEQKVRIFNLVAIHTDIFKIEPVKLLKRLKNMPQLYQDLHDFGKGDHGGAIRETNEPARLPICEPESLQPRNTDKKVVLMVGLPASGKSTYVKNNYKDY